MAKADARGPPNSIVPHVRTVLRDLINSPYAPLESPESCKRRASVAFIIRFQPSHAHWPESSTTKHDDFGSFFDQDWVQHGEPEVLFIKRASRKGDRWTSHIALPGGKRDPTDADDKAAAVRESWEEVGVDLEKYAIECGNLPQRIVTTHWGKKPLLVLCPYVFLLTQHEIPPLKLQPTEVAGTHWVPLRSLLSPSQRAVVFEDVSARIANQETGIKRWMCRMILGKMMFAAIHLEPTESLHSAESPVDSTLQDNRHAPATNRDMIGNLARRIYKLDLFNQFQPPPKEGPLLLWGLTLGVISDFLDLLPPHNALTLWTYPTFTPLDVRFTVWLLTYNFKNRKRVELQSGSEFLDTAKPSFGTASESYIPKTSAHSRLAEFPEDNDTTSLALNARQRPDETGLHGLGTGTGAGEYKGNKAAVATMLEGFVESCAQSCLPHIANRHRYYDIVRRAVTIALIGRFGVAAAVALLVYRRLGKR